jgi:antitoxin component of RelBE/YafQ-DinJ toxin-antitoxin module
VETSTLFRCMTERETIAAWLKRFVRLDEEALRALGILEALGMTRSEAIRSALVDAATRLYDKQALAAEVAALEADEEDLAEMLAVADLMESLRAPG